MTLWWLVLSARADPETDRLRQQQVVERAAAEVAEARADGARRAEVAERMASYRAAAAELERLEAAVGTVEEDRRRRQQALAELTRALAEGERESPARAAIAEWLGEPAARVRLLEEALPGTLAAPAEIRRGVLLDVVEQADALRVLLAFDAAGLERQADQLELRALGLRRTGPGQAASITAEVEALQLEEHARALEAEASAAAALAGRVDTVRMAAVAALEEVR